MTRILILCDYFLPGIRGGGPVVSVFGLADALAASADVRVMSRNWDAGSKTPYPGIRPNETFEMRGFRVLYLNSIWRVLPIVRDSDCGILYLNSLFSPLCLLGLMTCRLLRRDMKVVLAPRGELGAGALTLRRVKKRIFLWLFKRFGAVKRIIFHATSGSEADDIRRELGVGSVVIPNLPRPHDGMPVRRPKKPGCLSLTFVSRITRKKNLDRAICFLGNGVVGDVVCDIYGPIEDEPYWNMCLQMIDKLPKNVRVSYRGLASYEDVPRVLSSTHVLMLPTRDENFGHVIFEALQNGALPLISDQTPWRGLAEAGVGWDLPVDREEEWQQALQEAVGLDQDEFDRRSAAAARFARTKFNLTTLCENYKRLFEIDEVARRAG